MSTNVEGKAVVLTGGNAGLPVQPTPQVGQFVRLEGYKGRLVIKAVSEDGGLVDLVSECDPNYIRNNVPCMDLLIGEDTGAES